MLIDDIFLKITARQEPVWSRVYTVIAVYVRDISIQYGGSRKYVVTMKDLYGMEKTSKYIVYNIILSKLLMTSASLLIIRFDSRDRIL